MNRRRAILVLVGATSHDVRFPHFRLRTSFGRRFWATIEHLGEEAIDLTDDEIDRIRQCAETVAQAVIETFLDSKRPMIH